jgi:hypothetical protein
VGKGSRKKGTKRKESIGRHKEEGIRGETRSTVVARNACCTRCNLLFFTIFDKRAKVKLMTKGDVPTRQSRGHTRRHTHKDVTRVCLPLIIITHVLVRLAVQKAAVGGAKTSPSVPSTVASSSLHSRPPEKDEKYELHAFAQASAFASLSFLSSGSLPRVCVRVCFVVTGCSTSFADRQGAERAPFQNSSTEKRKRKPITVVDAE